LIGVEAGGPAAVATGDVMVLGDNQVQVGVVIEIGDDEVAQRVVTRARVGANYGRDDIRQIREGAVAVAAVDIDLSLGPECLDEGGDDIEFAIAINVSENGLVRSF